MADPANDTKIFGKKGYFECFQEAVMKLSGWMITRFSFGKRKLM